MSIFSVIVLAIVQGLTEFLPVSSKTHLLFTRHFLGMKPDLFFDVVLHGGSLLAILIYYRRDWLDLFGSRRKEIPRLFFATIPLVTVGLLLRKYFEPLYQNLMLASAVLMITGGFLYFADRYGKEKQGLLETPFWKVFLIGVAQAFAVLPGVSRAGSTIGAGYFCGIRRAEAVRFSFFLGAVAIAGALVLKTKEAMEAVAPIEVMPIVIGVFLTFAVSFGAIRLVEILSLKGRFSAFAIYCGAAGTLGLVYFASQRG